MKNHGSYIYIDNSSKGKKRRHNIYRADCTIRGIRYRKRSKKRCELVSWLKSMGVYYAE